MTLKSLKQIFKRPKAKSSAWDAAGSNQTTDFYSLQADICRSMIEGGEVFSALSRSA